VTEPEPQHCPNESESEPPVLGPFPTSDWWADYGIQKKPYSCCVSVQIWYSFNHWWVGCLLCSSSSHDQNAPQQDLKICDSQAVQSVTKMWPDCCSWSVGWSMPLCLSASLPVSMWCVLLYSVEFCTGTGTVKYSGKNHGNQLNLLRW